MKLFLIILCSFLPMAEIKSQIKFEFEIINSATKSEIKIRTTLTNISNKIQTIPKNRTIDLLTGLPYQLVLTS
jgi:hypothetical protein